MAPDASLCCAKGVGDDVTIDPVLAGMDWAVGRNVRVLNMSLGFPGYVDDFLGVTKVLRRRGVLPVFAIGNEGRGKTCSPGNYFESLSVGACDDHGRTAEFSGSDEIKRTNPVSGSSSYIVPDL